MYIRMDENMVDYHRHVKTAKGVKLTNTEMETLRLLVKEADDSELVPNAQLGNYIIKTVTNKIQPCSQTKTVTVEAMDEEVTI